MKHVLFRSVAAACATLVMALPAMAGVVTITDLYNTGVDNAGNLLGNNVADSHYSITNTGFTATTVSNSGYPIGTGNWIANNATSRWIGTQNNFSHAPDSTVLTFRTTFTIGADADLSTVSISGLGAVDNFTNSILINTTASGSSLSGFNSLQAFNVTSNFIIGTNTLDFLVLNACCAQVNPIGLRIDGISGTYMTKAKTPKVPEPSVFALFMLGLMGFGMRRFRK